MQKGRHTWRLLAQWHSQVASLVLAASCALTESCLFSWIFYRLSNPIVQFCAGAQQQLPALENEQPVYDRIVFEDGSTFTGTLKNGVPDGLGTCTWKDGNKYDGEWKAGVMHGVGTYIWTSGQRYDGEWKVETKP